MLCSFRILFSISMVAVCSPLPEDAFPIKSSIDFPLLMNDAWPQSSCANTSQGGLSCKLPDLNRTGILFPLGEGTFILAPVPVVLARRRLSALVRGFVVSLISILKEFGEETISQIQEQPVGVLLF